MEKFIFNLQRFADIENYNETNLPAIIISNSTNSTLITGTERNDSIYNEGRTVTIQALSGNDTIHHYNDDFPLIIGGDGNDSIYSDNGYHVTMSGGAGNDTIINYRLLTSSLSGGAGNDIISLSGNYDGVINGGKGNDTIYSDDAEHFYQYNSGDGKDIIYGFNDKDTIQISGASHTTAISGNDIIVRVGKGSLTLKDAKDKTLNIIGANEKPVNIVIGSSDKSRELVYGTDGRDSVDNGLYWYGTLDAGAGDDTIYETSGNISINAGADNDSIYTTNYDVTITGGTGNDTIRTNGRTLIKYSSGDGNDILVGWDETNSIQLTDLGTYSASVKGNDVILKAGTGSINIKEGARKIITIIDRNGKAYHKVFDSNNTIDAIYNEQINYAVVEGTSKDDFIYNSGYNMTINAGSGNDTIKEYSSEVVINGEAGDDSIYAKYDNTISGGTGNDTIELWKSERGSYVRHHNIIEYAEGDGNDVICNYVGAGDSWDDTIKIAASSYSTTTSDNDVIIKIGDGSILLKNAKSKVLNIDFVETISNFWKLSGTTATYGTSSKTLVTVKGVKSLDGISLSGKVVTVAASALNASKVTISGTGYTLALGSNVTKTSTKKAWSLSGTTATYKQTTAAGYKLASDKKSITYTKKATSTLATVKGVKDKSGLSVSGKVITVAASALNASKVTISGSGYTLALGSNVAKTSTKKAWSLSGTTATYKQTTSAGYKLASDKKSITYTKKATSTLATVKGAKSKSGFTVSGKTIKLATSSLSKNVSVSGSYAFDFASDYKSAKITGSSSNDTITTAGANMTITGGAGNDSIVSKGKNTTITGGKGKDTLTGGSGADVFVYSEGDGNDIITNYDETDKISLKSGAAEVSTSGNDVIFTVGDGKITVKGGNGKNITYIEDGKERTYPDKSDDVKYNAAGTGATLKITYEDDNFTPTEYSNYKNKLITINASEVQHALNITGNKNANKITGTIDDDTIKGGAGVDTILGGAGNDELYGEAGNDSLLGGKGDDSLWGGAGSDTLTGGAGNDIFYYDNGDGNDVITDYSPSFDKVVILSSSVAMGNPIANNSGDVTFKVGNGQIVFKNSANKYIELVNEGGTVLKQYNPV